MQRCDICIEEQCKCNGVCQRKCCDHCARIATCNKILQPTIRITTKCTQSCIHCCFQCSPKRIEQMSVETARTVKEFLSNNRIVVAALMGGEFCCNPDWKEIFDIIIPGLEAVRLVSNGDWNEDTAIFLARFPNLRVGISKDCWHKNTNVDRAASLCEKHGIEHRIATEDETTRDSIVPVGNGELHVSTYSMFQCYCQNPEHKYSFLIDEAGWIYKCGFGQWEYATVAKYAKGGFAACFKEFNQTFYGVFVPNCKTCARAYAYSKEKKEKS